MTYLSAIKHCYGHYATFAGRASRSEYWYWVLYSVISLIAACIIDGILGTRFVVDTGVIVWLPHGYIYSLVTLVNLLP
jgi:uncharacterized membrane protein YhaH (DUF805 family)